MATKKVVRLTLNLNTGGTKVMTLNAAPINNTLTDEDSGSTLTEPAAAAIIAAFEGDNGEKATSVDFAIVTTTTIDVAESVSGG